MTVRTRLPASRPIDATGLRLRSRRHVAFVGDARLTTLPAGDDRLVSFALDQKARIDRTVENDRRLAKGTFTYLLRRRQSDSAGDDA